MKNLILILFILISFISNGQVQFVSGLSWKIGDSTLVGEQEFYAKKNIATANALPKENQYWTTVRVITAPAEPPIDYRAKYDSVVTAFIIYQSQTAKEIAELNRIIDSITKPDEPEPPSQPSGPTERKLAYSFTLPKAATVSAGIYKGETLIKTLFSNRQYTAGEHVETIPYDSGVTVKVLSNNVKYEWEGVIANTSDSMAGATVHHGYAQIYAAMPYGDKLYASKYYSEGYPTQSVLKLSNIQSSDRIFNTEKKRAFSQNTTCIATDGNYVYWGGGDGYTTTTSYVFATKVSDNSEVSFDSGKVFTPRYGRTYKSTINLTFDSTNEINGLAVQKNGPYLFVSRSKINNIHVVQKYTGALVAIIPMNDPSGLAVDEDENLWICAGTNVNKYRVAGDGSIELLTPINGFSNPLSVSVKNGLVLVADAGASQQIKAFDYNGNPLWVFGQEGGQLNSASVTYDKFYLSRHASISIQDDGSFWFADINNNRLLHLMYHGNTVVGMNNDKIMPIMENIVDSPGWVRPKGTIYFIEQLLYTPHKYTSHVDHNNIESVFSDYGEFKVDYSKPLHDSWTFINNWRPQIDTAARNQYLGIRPVTFSNGKRYSLLSYPTEIVDGIKVKQHFRLFELTTEGKLRFTGLKFPNVTPLTIKEDGSIYVAPLSRLGTPMLFTKYPLLAYDGDNPVYGPVQTIATIKTPASDDPALYPLNAGEITSNGTIVKYEHNQTPYTYHLGGVKVGDTAYSFKTALSTGNFYGGVYPKNDAFDVGNSVVNAGNVAIVKDSIIYAGYKGEFWKSTQTNKWNVFHESGLMIGQFGTTGVDANYEAFAEMAGNVFNASVVKANGAHYLYHNDEGWHSGIHRWKISNMESIVVDNIEPVAVNIPTDTNLTDLMTGIPYDVVLNDSVSDWSRFPKTENYTNASYDYLRVLTYSRSYEREIPDIAITYAKRVIDSAFISRDLGDNNSNDWELSGKISVGGTYNSVNINNKYDSLITGAYLEILDNNNTPIFRLFSQQARNRNFVNTYINGKQIMSDSILLFPEKIKDFNDISIRCKDGVVTLNYLGQTSTVTANGNPLQPNKFRLYFFSNGARINRFVSVKELKFKK